MTVFRACKHGDEMSDVHVRCSEYQQNGLMCKMKRDEISSPSSTGYIQSVGFLSGCLFLQNNDLNAQ